MITPAEADRHADVVGRLRIPGASPKILAAVADHINLLADGHATPGQTTGAPLARSYLRRNQERRRRRVWWVRLAWLAAAFGAGLGVVTCQFLPVWAPPIVAAAGVTAYLYVLERLGLYAPRP